MYSRGRPKVEISAFGRNRKYAESDVSHSAETVCATESKEGL